MRFRFLLDGETFQVVDDVTWSGVCAARVTWENLVDSCPPRHHTAAVVEQDEIIHILRIANRRAA